jgi:hypothetical protein
MEPKKIWPTTEDEVPFFHGLEEKSIKPSSIEKMV